MVMVNKVFIFKNAITSPHEQKIILMDLDLYNKNKAIQLFGKNIECLWPCGKLRFPK